MVLNARMTRGIPEKRRTAVSNIPTTIGQRRRLRGGLIVGFDGSSETAGLLGDPDESELSLMEGPIQIEDILTKPRKTPRKLSPITEHGGT